MPRDCNGRFHNNVPMAIVIIISRQDTARMKVRTQQSDPGERERETKMEWRRGEDKWIRYGHEIRRT